MLFENTVNGSILLCHTYAQMRHSNETLNEFEHQLYESASSYLTTFLKFQRTILQASLLEAESKLNDAKTD